MDEERTRKASPLLVKFGLPNWSRRMPDCSDWTGLPVDSDAPARRRDAMPISAAVATLADKFGIRAANGRAEAAAGDAMLAAWRQAAGDLADRIVPERYVNGILYVVGGGSAEVFELRRTRLRAIEAAARRLAPFAGLRQIRIRAGAPAGLGLP